MKKSQGIRAAISAINTYGILVVPGLVDQRTAAGCAANADAALGESLLSCDGSSPCRYAVQLGLTHATRAAVLAVRGSAPMASALAAQLGDDAALCELSCEMSDGGAPIKPMHCATPACVEDAQTHYQEALAQRGASVLTLAHTNGRKAKVHLCAHNGRPRGLAHTAMLDLVLMDGGSGSFRTDEKLGRVVLGLAERVRRNETQPNGDLAPVARMMSHDERVQAFGPESLV